MLSLIMLMNLVTGSFSKFVASWRAPEAGGGAGGEEGGGGGAPPATALRFDDHAIRGLFVDMLDDT